MIILYTILCTVRQAIGNIRCVVGLCNRAFKLLNSVNSDEKLCVMFLIVCC